LRRTWLLCLLGGDISLRRNHDICHATNVTRKCN
jgi:hypothetical protein